MGKLKRKSSGYSPISKKVLSSLRKAINRKVIDISELKNAKIHAENLEKSVITEKELSELDPLHGVYAYGQNKISVFVEQIAELAALSKLTNAYADAEDIYMPSGPPMSPLTKSYFLCWGFFDLCVGIKKESFGTVIIDIMHLFKIMDRFNHKCKMKDRIYVVFRHQFSNTWVTDVFFVKKEIFVCLCGMYNINTDNASNVFSCSELFNQSCPQIA